MNTLKNKQLAGIGVLVLLLVGLPVTIFLTQQSQETRSRATASTTLYFTPSTTTTTPLQKNVGETVTYDVMIDPGSNLPSLVKLHLQYDTTKFQVAGPSSFVVNTAAFPTTLEGPIVSNGNVYVSVSIGSDGTKAIQQVTKVGTLTLTTLAPTTTAPTLLSFGDKAQVLSIAANDQANENVLSTTTPAYTSIVAATTPTPTLFPTPTMPPTPTFVPATVTPSPTTITTATPTDDPTATASPTTMITTLPSETTTPPATTIPTATTVPTTPPTTKLSFAIFMHGIGNSGDNANPTNHALSNKNPLHPTRDVSVLVYDVNNQLAASKSGTITYNTTNGNFVGTVDFGNALPQGAYTVKVQSPSHLRRLVPGIQTIIPQQDNVLPAATLIAGDITGDNSINILDYNLLIGCYSDLLPAVSCTEANKILTDLDDDGKVNQIDYNFFLREITVQAGS